MSKQTKNAALAQTIADGFRAHQSVLGTLREVCGGSITSARAILKGAAELLTDTIVKGSNKGAYSDFTRSARMAAEDACRFVAFKVSDGKVTVIMDDASKVAAGEGAGKDASESQRKRAADLVKRFTDGKAGTKGASGSRKGRKARAGSVPTGQETDPKVVASDGSGRPYDRLSEGDQIAADAKALRFMFGRMTNAKAAAAAAALAAELAEEVAERIAAEDARKAS